jgi:hypothetical protein
MSSPQRLPAPVEPGLPADPNAFLDPNEEPVPPEVLNGPVPGQDSRFYDDLYNDSGNAPQEVVEDVLPEVRRAEPAPREVTASTMDLSFINKINDPSLTDEQARAEYDKLPPALRYVYDRVADFSYNNPDTQTPAQLDPRDANRWLDEFYKTQSDQNTPKAAAETDAAFARAQRAFGATQKIDYAIKRIMGEEGKPRYKSYVGAYSMSPLGFVPGTETRQFQTDLASLKALLGLAAAGETKGQGTVSNYERELYGAASSIGLDLSNTEDSFKETLLQIKKQNDAQMAENESMLNKLQGKRPAAAGQSPQQSAADEPADTRPRNTLMGTIYAVNPDGTLEKVAK